MATALPEKIYLNISVPGNLTETGLQRARQPGYDVAPSDLTPEALTKYLAHYAERDRRLDPSQPDVAQEALDCLEELKAAGRSTAELWEQYGYSIRSTVKPAIREEARLVRELETKPTVDVIASTEVALKVADVRTKFSIAEFVPKVVEEIPAVEELPVKG